jgi:hypothetical protein
VAREQVVYVRERDLRRKARIDGAASRGAAVQLHGREGGVHDVPRLNTEAREVAAEERGEREHVEHPRDADAEIPAPGGTGRAAPRGRGPGRRGGGSATDDTRGGAHTSRAAIATRFGVRAIVASSAALTVRISCSEPAAPFSHGATIRRRSTAGPPSPGTRTSMNVRRHSFVQK